jgi:hypothetical protein
VQGVGIQIAVHVRLKQLSPSRNRAWTDRTARSIITAMRFILLSLLLFLAACGSDPAALGVTGAPLAVPPADPGELQTGIPGAPNTGTQLSPSQPANTGSGKFWGYN